MKTLGEMLEGIENMDRFGHGCDGCGCPCCGYLKRLIVTLNDRHPEWAEWVSHPEN